MTHSDNTFKHPLDKLDNQDILSDSPDANRQMPAWTTSLHDLANLHKVDEQLYRSEQLEADEAVLLTKHKIDAVINLRFFDRNDNKQRFAERPELQHVTFYNCPLMAWYVTAERIATILWQIKSLQNQGQSVLVHCYHGADRTGIIIAMYRIVLQGWPISYAKEEMIQGNYGYHAIWRNLEKMLNQEEVSAVIAAYHALREADSN